jgi:hypothetical protein
MAVLIVCLFGVVRGVSGGGLSSGDSVGDSAAVAGNFSAFALSLGAATRTSAWLWVLDMWCLSVICLEVNHAESLYWVLVSAFVGTLALSLGGSARAL